MLLCPVCKERKGSFYKATSEALGDLLDLMPSLSEGMEHWLLIDGTPEGFADDDGYTLVGPFKDQMLVLICQDCAAAARTKLRLYDGSFYQLQADQCFCCGYYTLIDLSVLCSVCFWQEGGGANRVTLSQARENFRLYGASLPEFIQSVRPPRAEEHPRYYQ